MPSDIIFWSVLSAALAITLIALVVRNRREQDQAYHSPLLLLGLAGLGVIIFVILNALALSDFGHGAMLDAAIIWGGLALVGLWTLQTLYYRLSWDERALRIRRLLRHTVEVPWQNVKSLKMETADAIEMHIDHPRLKKHTFSTYLVGRRRLVDALQRYCSRPPNASESPGPQSSLGR